MKKLLTCLALSFVAASSYAATPLWLRDVQISPDGTEIAFCYKGDIYKVPANGGTATQLTTQASYECSPIWSPDSKQIAFASDRNGNFDLFVMSADGGAARRLTTHSASETRTFKGKILIQNDGLKLRPGMFIKADIVVNKADSAIIIPKDVIQSNRRVKYVYIVEKNTALLRELKTGLEDDKNIQILEGLKENDNLVVKGFETLKENAKVKVQK